ncbi:MAG: hypothetical protein COA90_11110 [Gammaproteobacteria bacterium]|nr:MAG: hypothetical protein COA90_11110 [Gammaproteobacteria bacterium]
MNAEGQGVTQDYKQAVNWYREAAEQGDALAHHYISRRARLNNS